MSKKAGGILFLFLILTLLLLSPSLPAQEIGKGVKITYLGHSAFKLISPQGVILLIDPYLSNYPKTPPDQPEAFVQEMKDQPEVKVVVMIPGKTIE